MQENIKISKVGKKKRNKLLKNNKFLRKNCNCFISFGQMSQNESI